MYNICITHMYNICTAHMHNIMAHRHLQSNGATYRVAMNTFTHDARINFDRARNFSHAHTGGGSSESAANLKKALAKHGE